MSIEVDYNGNYAKQIAWQEDKLAGFVKAADLRTNITIKDSDDNPQNTTTRMGSVLAFKRLANPLEMFGQQTSLGEEATVSTNFESGEGSISVNHKIVTANVLERSKGRMDERMFVEQINQITKQGLTEVLFQEKRAQLLSSLFVDGTTLGITGLFALPGYVIFRTEPFSKFFSFLNSLVQSETTLIEQVAYKAYDLVSSGMFFMSAAGFLALTIVWMRNYDHTNRDPYMLSTRKFNFLKHPKDFLGGELYLLRHGKSLASYQQDTTSN